MAWNDLFGRPKPRNNSVASSSDEQPPVDLGTPSTVSSLLERPEEAFDKLRPASIQARGLPRYSGASPPTDLGVFDFDKTSSSPAPASPTKFRELISDNYVLRDEFERFLWAKDAEVKASEDKHAAQIHDALVLVNRYMQEKNQLAESQRAYDEEDVEREGMLYHRAVAAERAEDEDAGTDAAKSTVTRSAGWASSTANSFPEFAPRASETAQLDEGADIASETSESLLAKVSPLREGAAGGNTDDRVLLPSQRRRQPPVPQRNARSSMRTSSNSSQTPGPFPRAAPAAHSRGPPVQNRLAQSRRVEFEHHPRNATIPDTPASEEGEHTAFTEMRINTLLFPAMLLLTSKRGEADMSEAAKHAQQAMALAEHINHDALVGRSAFYVALAHFDMGNLEIAMEYFEKAEQAKGVYREGDRATAWYKHCNSELDMGPSSDQSPLSANSGIFNGIFNMDGWRTNVQPKSAMAYPSTQSSQKSSHTAASRMDGKLDAADPSPHSRSSTPPLAYDATAESRSESSDSPQQQRSPTSASALSSPVAQQNDNVDNDAASSRQEGVFGGFRNIANLNIDTRHSRRTKSGGSRKSSDSLSMAEEGMSLFKSPEDFKMSPKDGVYRRRRSSNASNVGFTIE